MNPGMLTLACKLFGPPGYNWDTDDFAAILTCKSVNSQLLMLDELLSVEPLLILGAQFAHFVCRG